MNGFLTTHVLDTAKGCPAAGIQIELFRYDNGQAVKLGEAVTNADGRTDSPILSKETFALGQYELVFHAGDYLRRTGQAGQAPLFLDVVPIRFGMSQDDHYHVPLLLSAHGFSTYRGSLGVTSCMMLQYFGIGSALPCGGFMSSPRWLGLALRSIL